MKIIFFGTPHFAANILEFLLFKKSNVIGVVTSVDSQKGRGKKISFSPVKKIALESNIPILQPYDLNSIDFYKSLKNFNADIFIVVAFRMLPKKVWSIPKFGSINLHTSFLPNYRGAAPINWVLINNEKYTGVTIFLINEKIDSGQIIIQEMIKLTNETTAGQLHDILIQKGNALLIKSLSLVKANTVPFKKQVHDNKLKKAPKIYKQMLKIDWSKTANEIHNLIRGFSPYISENKILKNISICPGVWFLLKDKSNHSLRIKILLSKIEDAEGKNHLKISSDNKSYFKINVYDKAISIIYLQSEGKKIMRIDQFLSGYKIDNYHSIS